jgi:hypothetical protein
MRGYLTRSSVGGSRLSMDLQVVGQGAAAGKSPTAMHELGRRRRIGILLICSMSLLIVGLDVTIVNVALPSISSDLHASVSGLQWTIDAYTLVLTSLVLCVPFMICQHRVRCRR